MPNERKQRRAGARARRTKGRVTRPGEVRRPAAPGASTRRNAAKIANYSPSVEHQLVKAVRATALSPCATAYALALKDPFDAPLACVPSYPPLPSQKLRVWARGTMVTGTAGWGGVIVRPLLSAMNDYNTVLTTTGTFAGTSLPNPGDAGTQLYATNNPYNSTQIVNNMQARIVACGIRLWNTTAQLSIGGTEISLIHPDNESIAGLSFAQMSEFNTAQVSSPDDERTPIVLTWLPTRPVDFEYQTGNQLLTHQSYSMGFLVQAPSVSTPQQYAFECFAQVEYVGANAPARSFSAADPNGMAAVLTAAENGSQISHGKGYLAMGKDLLRKAGQMLAENSGTIAETGGRLLGGIARGALGLGPPNPLGAPTGYISLSSGPTIEDVTEAHEDSKRKVEVVLMWPKGSNGHDGAVASTRFFDSPEQAQAYAKEHKQVVGRIIDHGRGQ